MFTKLKIILLKKYYLYYNESRGNISVNDI